MVGKKNGIVIQGLCSVVSGVDRDTVQLYNNKERDYITYRIKTDQQSAGVTTCRCKVNSSSGTVYWGDSTFDNYTSSLDLTHDYGTAGTYDIYLYTTSFTYSDVGNNDRPKYLLIRDFRKQVFNGFQEYTGLANIDVDPTAGGPTDSSRIRRPSRGFTNCDSLTTVNASEWVDFPTNMSFSDRIFSGCDSFNDAGVAGWNVEQFPNFNDIFSGCTSFDVDLSAWATKFVKSTALSIGNLFSNASSFTNGGVGGVGAGLDSWQLNNVTGMSGVFGGSCGFNDRLDSWDTSRVTNMSSMFSDNTVFTNAGVSGAGLGIDAWDTSAVTDMGFMFSNYRAGAGFYVGSWDTSNVTDMERVFGSTTFKFSDWGTWNNGSIDNWDVSNATTMSQMFNDVPAFNQPLNSWRPSSCVNFTQMFAGLNNSVMTFDQNVGAWTIYSSSLSTGTNTSIVTNALVDSTANFTADLVEAGHRVENITDGTIATVTAVTATQLTLDADIFLTPAGDSYRVFKGVAMNIMFGRHSGSGAHAFNNGGSNTITNWNVQNVTTMDRMFRNCTSFNQPLGWTTSALLDTKQTFQGASSFNQDIGGWDMGKVTTAEGMFSGAGNFNNGGSASIANWDLSKVTTTASMFYGAGSFNQNVPDWDFSSCLTFSQMFRNATSFNGTVTNWVTDSVQSFYFMFSGASAFNKDVSNWSIASLTDATGFMGQGSGFQSVNYNALLDSVNGWPSQSTIQSNVTLSSMPTYTLFSNAQTGRNILTGTYGWTIVDQGGVP